MTDPKACDRNPVTQAVNAAAAHGLAAVGASARFAPTQRRLLTFTQLRAKLNVSTRTARKVVAEPWMADPIELRPRVLRWDEAEVDEALASRAPRRAEPAPEPSQLTRGRAAKQQDADSKTADQLVG